MYSVELDERYIYRVDVLASSAAQAIEKVKTFYAQQRQPVPKYQEEGLTAILQSHSADTPPEAMGAWTSPFSVGLHERYVSMYFMEMHERYVYDVKVIATSAAEAMQKLNAFYAKQRKPETRYAEGDLTGALQAKSVRRRRRALS